jgi:hypothetical protein
MFRRRNPFRDPEHFRISGKDHYSLGLNSARRTGKAARFIIGRLRVMARRFPEVRRIAEEASEHSKTLRRMNPSRFRELEGMAFGLSMNAEDLIAAGKILEGAAIRGCTNFGAVPPATTNDQVVISWNFDAPFIFKWLMGRFPLFVREVEGTTPYVCMGFPAWFGVGIMNAEGLSCVVNAVGMTDEGRGLSVFELNNTAMESCSTVDEAAAIFSRGPREAIRCMETGMLMNWNMIWADLTGDLSVFEYSHNHFHRERASGDGIIASANHHQFLDRKLSGSFDPSTHELIAGSYSRLARMWALLREYQGRIDQMVAKRIVSDHVPDYSVLREFGIHREWWDRRLEGSTICEHLWNFKRNLFQGNIMLILEEIVSMTLYSMQVWPRKYTVWLAAGHPCKKLSIPFYWGKALGVEAEPFPGARSGEEASPDKERERRGLFRKDASVRESAIARLWYGLIRIAEAKNFPRRHPSP